MLQSVFLVRIAVRDPAALAPAREALEAELRQLAQEGPSQAELTTARTLRITDNLGDLDTHLGLTSRLGLYPQHLSRSDWLREDLERYDGLTVEEVRAFVRTYLTPEHRAAVAGPFGDSDTEEP